MIIYPQSTPNKYRRQASRPNRWAVKPLIASLIALGFMGEMKPAQAETCVKAYGRSATTSILKKDFFGSFVNDQNLTIGQCAIAFEWWGGGSTDQEPRGFVNPKEYTIELIGDALRPGDNRVLSFINIELDLFENAGTVIGSRANGTLAMTMYGGSIKRFVNSGSFGNPDGNGGLYLSASNPVITELINTGTMSTDAPTIIINRGSIDLIDNSGTLAAKSAAVFMFNQPLARTTIINNSGQITRGTDAASTEDIFIGPSGRPITKAVDFRNLKGGLVQGTINLGSANDLVTLYGGSTVTGHISGGSGIDGITLTGEDGTHKRDITAFDTLTKTGTGTWSLAGATEIESSIAIDSGSILSTGAMSAPSVTIADGASLLIGNGAAGGSLDADTVTNSGILTFDRSDDYTFDAVLAAAGQLLHAGAGTLTLSGNSTFSGQTTVSSGTLALTQDTSAGTSLIKLNDGTTLQANAPLTLSNQIEISANAILNDQGNNITLNAAISGAGNLTKQGLGELTLGAQNTFAGTLSLAGGSLKTGIANALSEDINLTLAGGTVASLENLDQSIGALSGAGRVSLGSATLTTSSSTDTSFSGVISGDGGLTKSGNGTLTLSGQNTYLGTTTVTAGTLATDGVNRLATTSNIELALGATLALGGNQTVGSLAGSGDIDIANHTLSTTISTDTTFAGQLLGSGGRLVIDAANTSNRLVLTGESNFSGIVTINQGTLALDNAYALGFDTLVQLTSGGVLEIDQPTLIGQLIEDGGALTGDRKNLFTTLVTTFSGALDASISDIDDSVVGSYKSGVVKLSKSDDPGITTIEAQMAYTGTTKVKGGTLQLIDDGAFNDASSLIMYAQGILDLNNRNQTFASIAGQGGEIKLGSGILTDSGTENSRYAGTITGTGSIAKGGSSTWILAGDNTYAGTTTINAGILALEQSESVGVGEITIATAATLRADADLALGNNVTLGNAGTIATQVNDVTLSGVVSGTSLIKTGTGTLTLVNRNTYTGSTTVTGGTLALEQSESIGQSSLTLGEQTTLQANANLNLNNRITLDGIGTLATQDNAVSLTAVIDGDTGVLRKTGSGVLTLSGANTYAGGTNLAGGTIVVSNDLALGKGTLTATGTGVKLQADSSAVTLANAIALSQDLIVDTNGQTVTLDEVTSGLGGLIKQGAGTLTLGASNTYRGGTTVSTGTLALGAGDSAGTGNITMAANTTLGANSAMTVNNAITLVGQTFLSHQNRAVTLAGIIDGAGSLDKLGSGVLTLSGANTYSGGTTVSGGTLALGAENAAGAGTINLADGTTLQSNETITVANAIAITGTGTINTQDKDVTVSGVISGANGSDNLTKTGTGTLTLASTNTYTGVTTVSQGTLATAGNNNLAAVSSVVIADGAKLALGGDQTFSSFEGAGDIDLGHHVLTTTMAKSTTFSGALIGDAGQLIVQGTNSETLRLQGDSSFSGQVLVNGATLALNSLNALGLYTVLELDRGAILEIESDTILGAVIGEVNPDPNVPNIVEKNGAKLQSLLTITKSDTIAVDITDVNFAGQTYQAGLVKVSDGSTSGGTSFIEAVEHYTGLTAVRQGRLQLRGDGELASAGFLAMYESGVFGLNPDKDQAFAGLSGAGGIIELGARRLTINNPDDNRYGGVITGEGGQFTKAGTGTLVLSGANTHTGGTLIANGILAAANADALGTGSITFENEATLRADVDLNLTNAIVLAQAGRIDTQSQAVSITGRIRGGALVKAGDGLLTLTNRNTYDGGTIVKEGTLALSGSQAAGTGTITMKDATTLLANTDLALTNAIDVFGSTIIDTQAHRVELLGSIYGDSIVKTGSGSVILSNDNNEYTGGTKLVEGTIVAASNTALGTGELTAGGQGVTLAAGKSDLRLSNAIALSTDLIVDTAGEQMLLSGEISGTGKLIKQGAGELELAGSNQYLGGTEVKEGTLALDADAAASTAEVIMAADTTIKANTNLTLANVVDLLGPVTFDTQGFNVTLNAAVINNSGGQLIKTGAGTLTLNATNTYTAGTVIEQGTLALYGSLISGVQVQSGTIFGGTGTVTGDVTNAGAIVPRLNGARSTLTIIGNYVGEDGTFASTLSGSASAIEADRLAIQGAGNVASGSTTVTVADPSGLLGNPTTGDGILLVGVTAGARSTTSAFRAPRIAAGAYEYTLVRGGESSAESWFLRADNDQPAPPVIITPAVAQREEVALYPALPSLARQYLWSINGTLDDRRGSPEAIGQWERQPIAWGRFIAQGNERKPGNVNSGPGLKAQDWGLQLGVDLHRGNSGWGQWRVGPVATLGRSTGNAYNTTGTVQTGNVSLNAYSLGLNATLASHEGAYADLLLLGTRLTGVQANSALGTAINTTGWAFSGSLEGGWRVPMTSKLAITPQAQVYVTNVDLNSTKDAFSLIDMPTQTTTLGRLGLKVSYDNVTEHGRAQFWARASVFSTLSGKDASTSFSNIAGANPTTFQSAAPSTWMALDAAVDVQASKNINIQLGLGYQTSLNSQYRGIYGQVNVRFGF